MAPFTVLHLYSVDRTGSRFLQTISLSPPAPVLILCWYCAETFAPFLTVSSWKWRAGLARRQKGDVTSQSTNTRGDHGNITINISEFEKMELKGELLVVHSVITSKEVNVTKILNSGYLISFYGSKCPSHRELTELFTNPGRLQWSLSFGPYLLIGSGRIWKPFAGTSQWSLGLL